MFHFGRSGSTVLGDMLDQHPQVFWDSEIYEPYTQTWKSQKNLAEATSTYTPTDILSQRIIQGGKKLYGFEVKFFHLKLANIELSNYLNSIQGLGIDHFIVLKRKNYLRKIVSSAIASKVSQYHQSSEQKARFKQVEIDIGNVEIDCDAKSLIAYMQEYDEDFSILEKLLVNKKVLWLTYEEDLFLEPRHGYSRVCDFLDITPHPVLIHYSKTNPFKLSEIITNFEDVERTLSGTSFEWMLYE